MSLVASFYQPWGGSCMAAKASDLRRLAARIRLNATRMVAIQGFGYLGQALSSAEIFAVLFGGGFVRAGANMIGIAGGLARAGHTVFINTFGVFCTRRCYDQTAMAVAYPNLNVKIVG